MTHTDGPWEMDTTGMHDCDGSFYIIAGPDGRGRDWTSIATVRSSYDDGNKLVNCSREEVEANARVLAAAPEMLRTLQTLLNDLTNPNTMEVIRTGPHVALLQQTIDKAT